MQGRVEGLRTLPNLPQPRPHLGTAKVGHVYAKTLAAIELGIVLAEAGEVGIEVDAEPNVADHQERRPALGMRQVARVALGLALGLQHMLGPTRRVPNVGTVLRLVLTGEQLILR